MKHILLASLGVLTFGLAHTKSSAQISVQKNYKNYNSATIGTFQGITFREAGFSGLYAIPGTDGKEFWVCSDRGVNIDAGNANSSSCRPTYDKIYAFPSYAPKIHRIRIQGDSIQILRTMTVKRPNGTPASGIINPTGLGSTFTEVASTDTVMNCANFNLKTTAKDTFGIDCEGIVVDKDGNFWLCEEGGPTIWKLDQNGRVVKRYSPYVNLGGAQSVDVQIDTVFKYRKNNRGFEGIAIAPNGKIYAIIQSPILYPTQSVGEGTRVHRILEIDPVTNATRMFAYLNDGIIGSSGSNQIRLRDWKIGDMAAINDSTFLVIEAALRGTSDYKRMYKISLNGATPVHSGLYSGVTLEALVDAAGLAANNITPVGKTLVMDLLANGWPAVLDKAEGLAIINDSTIAICNDNDYGQYSPAENGLATATTNLSNLFVYNLKGANKLQNLNMMSTTLSQGITGPNSSQDPYLVPTVPGAWYKSIMTVRDAVPGTGYPMTGLLDGVGAYDNGNGTFTVVIGHEMNNTQGAVHAHGSTGAFVSQWTINKSDMSVTAGSDEMQRIFLWNKVTQSYVAYNAASPSSSAAFSRFCSADLPAVSAFYNEATGLGTKERIFMNGEEAGAEGRAVGHILTGTAAGTSYELPALGKFSWENSVANPGTGDKTVVAGMDDATPGQVYMYIGTKTNSGTDIEKAGLTNGALYGVRVPTMLVESNSSSTAATSFTLVNLGNVTNMTGSQLQSNSNSAGVTQFLRPEDGAWDPQNPADFYFVTTNGFNNPSRLWKLSFSDINDLTKGGTIEAVLNGTEGQQMMDNLTIDNFGHVLIQEDCGNVSRIGKTWQYNTATDQLKLIGTQDTTRFSAGGANYLTQDEEASGIIDVQEILGPGMFVAVDQAHYSIPSPYVDGGQLLVYYNPDTYNANPEVDLQGNSVSIINNDMTPNTADNTDMGGANLTKSVTKTFTLRNGGVGPLEVTGISFTGTNANEFALSGAPTFPLTVAASGSQTFTVEFKPTGLGDRTATLNVKSNDVDEKMYTVALKGTGTAPEIEVTGNGYLINNGDLTPGIPYLTDFGARPVNSTTTNTFQIHNKGTGSLTINSIVFGGNNAADFTLAGAATLPMTVAPNSAQTFGVQFRPSAEGTRTASVSLTSDDVDEGNYSFQLAGSGLATTGITTAHNFSGLKLYPNPTDANTTVEVMLTKDMNVTVTVTDIQGKLVIPAVEKNCKAGEQKIVLNTAALANGTYHVKVACGGVITKTSLVIAH